MKTIKLLAPLLSAASISSLLVPLTSCGEGMGYDYDFADEPFVPTISAKTGAPIDEAGAIGDYLASVEQFNSNDIILQDILNFLSTYIQSAGGGEMYEKARYSVDVESSSPQDKTISFAMQFDDNSSSLGLVSKGQIEVKNMPYYMFYYNSTLGLSFYNWNVVPLPYYYWINSDETTARKILSDNHDWSIEADYETDVAGQKQTVKGSWNYTNFTPLIEDFTLVNSVWGNLSWQSFYYNDMYPAESI